MQKHDDIKGGNAAGRKVSVTMTIEGLGGDGGVGYKGGNAGKRDFRPRTHFTDISKHGENCIFTANVPGTSQVALSKSEKFIPGRYMRVEMVDLEDMSINITRGLIKSGKLKIENGELVGI
jgi:hypothetical protein